MNKDESKFILVVYEKNNFDNRKFININGKKGCFLSLLDSATSKYKKEQFYDALVNSKIIDKEHTEFVIWYKEKKLIKQLPVIFDDYNIKIYSEYINGNNDKEHIKKYEDLTDSTFWNIIKILDKESKEYDKLGKDEQDNYLNNNSLCSKISRMPFALYKFKSSVKDRIFGVYQDKDNRRVKNNLSYCRNFSNIKKYIETSYRCFRDSYLILRNNINYEELYKDLDFNELNNKLVELKQEEKKELLNKSMDEKEYNVIDYLELINNFETRFTFNDFVYESSLVSKKVKDYTNRLAQSMFDCEDINIEAENVIKSYYFNHKDKINKLIHEYMNQKRKVL